MKEVVEIQRQTMVDTYDDHCVSWDTVVATVREPADRAGLRPGDRIIGAEGREPISEIELRLLLKESAEKPVRLADVADHFLVVAWTDQDKKKKRDHSGMSAFIVERAFEGFSSYSLEEKWGILAGNTGGFSLQDVEVPVENRVGEEGEGFKIAMSALEFGRLTVSARSVGLAQACLDEARRYAERKRSDDDGDGKSDDEDNCPDDCMDGTPDPCEQQLVLHGMVTNSEAPLTPGTAATSTAPWCR